MRTMEEFGFADSDQVELWRIPLDGEAHDAVASREPVLSGEERRRAERFHDPVQRHRFEISRTALRHILAERLGAEPGDIAFAYGPYGKPALDGPGHGGLHFNLSHGEDWALIAVGTTGRLGVDIERIQHIPEWEEMAAACLTPEEREQIAALPEVSRALAFIRAWTCREALLKALGWGWTGPAVRFRAPFAPGLVVKEIPAPAGYVAALARPDSPHRIVERTWSIHPHFSSR